MRNCSLFLAFILLSCCLASASASGTLKVLVFGDSQGDTGPTYHALQDVLNKNRVAATVINKSIGGTRACGWAEDKAAIVKAAQESFPGSSPDLVWYTAGANDLAQNDQYHTCLAKAASDDDAAACISAANALMMNCTEILLENLWAAFPNAKVGQYNYDVPCLDVGSPGVADSCLPAAAQFLGGAYCLNKQTNEEQKTCLGRALMFWQSIYVDALQKKYPQPQYTGMNVLGTVQKAAGIPGAAVGTLVLGQGAKCEWEVECVHPKYGTPAATGIADAMWKLWVSKVVNQTSLAVAAA